MVAGYSLTVCLPGISLSIFFLIAILIVVPIYLGFDVRFHYLDVIVVLLSPVMTMVMTNFIAGEFCVCFFHHQVLYWTFY